MSESISPASLLVFREVGSDLTSFIATLDQNVGLPNLRRSALGSLIDQAAALSAPILDHEGAARAEGWERHEIDGYFVDPADGSAILCNDWREACQIDALTPQKREIREHRAVSNWLAKQLVARGERVDTNFAGLNVWARTSNEPIRADALILKIVAETSYPSGANA